MILINNCIFNIYVKIYDEALEYFEKSLKINENLGIAEWIAKILEIIGYVLNVQKKYIQNCHF